MNIQERFETRYENSRLNFIKDNEGHYIHRETETQYKLFATGFIDAFLMLNEISYESDNKDLSSVVGNIISRTQGFIG